VFDYAPQHQSTCGLNFNVGQASRLPGAPAAANSSATLGPTSGPPAVHFGPSWWAGDAIVSGYSRGKLWRTKLVKTAAGYVAQNQLFACLNALTVDACVSPKGDLVVATHSGQPDWGSGPTGFGKLYQVNYAPQLAPQPVVAWAASPTEIRVAFDRELDPGKLRGLARHSSITQGKYAFPGDRFETMRPGYQVVFDQLATPRYNVPVLSASLSGDRRTLILPPSHGPPLLTTQSFTEPSRGRDSWGFR
jgi:hypothetical protein